jgi:hypothetical protein
MQMVKNEPNLIPKYVEPIEDVLHLRLTRAGAFPEFAKRVRVYVLFFVAHLTSVFH